MDDLLTRAKNIDELPSSRYFFVSETGNRVFGAVILRHIDECYKKWIVRTNHKWRCDFLYGLMAFFHIKNGNLK